MRKIILKSKFKLNLHNTRNFKKSYLNVTTKELYVETFEVIPKLLFNQFSVGNR